MPRDGFDAAFDDAKQQLQGRPDAFDAQFSAAVAQLQGPAVKAHHPLEILDPRKWRDEAPPRRWIIPDWLPRGVVTGLYGEGGTGKSLLAMQLLASTAMALPWLGLDGTPCRALGVFCEDDADELHRRQVAVNAALGVEMQHLENLRLVSRVGLDNALMCFDGGDIGALTPFWDDLDRAIAEWKPGLVVLDTAADMFPANENDRAKVRQFVGGALGRLALAHDCAVLLCAHPSLTGINTGTGASGSTAWSNTMRSRWFLTRPAEEGASDGARVLSRVKANYAPRDAKIDLIWRRGTFEFHDPSTTAGEDVQWPTIEAMFDEIERAWNEGRAWSHSAQTRDSGRYFPGMASKRFGVPEKRVKTLLAGWIENRCLSVEEFDARAKTRGLKVLRRPSQ